MKTLFERILNREIPADLIYEDEVCAAFKDISPQAPTHILVVPRKPVRALNDNLNAALAGHLLVVANKIAEQQTLANGYRIVINCGPDGGQTVDHLHLHILGGRPLEWPPG